MPRTVKVAVIGSGLAGLTAAYLLTKPRADDLVYFEVHLFEKASTIGMGASSVSVPLPDSGDSWSVDVPMRSFQGGYYPQLIALYKSLGVAFRKADFSYSFSFLTPPTKDHGRKITATMIYNGGSGRAGVSMPSILKSQRLKNQGFLPFLLHKTWSTGLFVILTAQLLLCYVMTLFYSLPFWRSSKLSAMKFGDWAKNVAPKGMLARRTGMDIAWQDYFQTVLLPLFSAVCTAPLLWNSPLRCGERCSGCGFSLDRESIPYPPICTHHRHSTRCAGSATCINTLRRRG